jgi:hypothetical protein
MAIVPKSDLLNKFQTIVGDNTSDDVLNFLDDMKDTLDDFEKRSSVDSEWKAKYEANDKAWRERYRDRFMNGAKEPDEMTPNVPEGNGGEGDNEPKLKTSFSELFE